MKIEHADSPGKIAGCVKLDSFFDELSEHFSLPPRKHVHIVVHVPPMCEYSRHPFMLPNLLIDVPLFLHYRSLYIFIDVACRLIPPLSPFMFFSSISTHLAMLAPMHTINFLVPVPQHRLSVLQSDAGWKKAKYPIHPPGLRHNQDLQPRVRCVSSSYNCSVHVATESPPRLGRHDTELALDAALTPFNQYITHLAEGKLDAYFDLTQPENLDPGLTFALQPMLLLHNLGKADIDERIERLFIAQTVFVLFHA